MIVFHLLIPIFFCFIEKIKEISNAKIAEIKDVKEQGGRRPKRNKF
jgi:hypothetical protein